MKAIYFLSTVLALLLVGCSKNDPFLSNETQKDEPQLKNGRLSFTSMDEFQEFKSKIRQNKSFYQNGTFQSLHKSSPIDVLVPDMELALILNEKRELEIGGIIFRITEKGIFAFEEIHSFEVDKLQKYSSEVIGRDENTKNEWRNLSNNIKHFKGSIVSYHFSEGEITGTTLYDDGQISGDPNIAARENYIDGCNNIPALDTRVRYNFINYIGKPDITQHHKSGASHNTFHHDLRAEFWSYNYGFWAAAGVRSTTDRRTGTSFDPAYLSIEYSEVVIETKDALGNNIVFNLPSDDESTTNNDKLSITFADKSGKIGFKKGLVFEPVFSGFKIKKGKSCHYIRSVHPDNNGQVHPITRAWLKLDMS